MNAKFDRDDAASEAVDERLLVQASRRRLTRAGLLTPVVLSSLASKPVLGAAPYQCTVSGQVSGNLSRSSDQTVCDIGNTPATWLLAGTSWPSQISKGALPDGACTFNTTTRIRGTNFNGYAKPGTQALASAFFNLSASSICSVVSTSTSNPATMYQVLKSADTSDLFKLGRATVTSLLNSYQFAPNYAVTDAMIIAMFNATYAGGTYAVNSTVSWSRAQVIAYLQKLYIPSP